MKQSQEIGELVKALVKVQAALKPVELDGSSHFGKYATLAAVWKNIRKTLAENELAVIQTMDTEEDNKIYVYTTLAHTSGQWISGRCGMKMSRNDPQVVGQIITYFRRYSLGAILGIVTEEDVDGEIGQNRGKQSEKPKSGRDSKKDKDSDGFYTQLEKAQEIKIKIDEEEYYNILKAFGKEHANKLLKIEMPLFIEELVKVEKRNKRYLKVIETATSELPDNSILTGLIAHYGKPLTKILKLSDQLDIFDALNEEYRAAPGKELK